MNIRRATSNDIEILQNLNLRIFSEDGRYDSDVDRDWVMSEKGRSYFIDLLSNKEKWCLIAEDNNQPVGYIVFGPKEVFYRRSKYMEIETLGIIPEYQSKGVGTQLMNEACKWGKANGYDKMYVISYFHNMRANTFYKKNGFEEIDLALERKI